MCYLLKELAALSKALHLSEKGIAIVERHVRNITHLFLRLEILAWQDVSDHEAVRSHV